ncbi:tetratricopeptide repeat protein [Paenibacillus yanchengensis]|uniref:Tetratricopeptide repeat protein n=1 Tax=Paenibacillus yanchengensis TaxID=2035833 RepID=A0ABW4YQZ2_9BACL
MLWLWIVLYILVSYAIIILCFKQTWPEKLLKMVVVTALPVVGWLMPIFFPRRLINQSDEKFADYVERQQEAHSIRNMGIHQIVGKEEELNVVSIEEALIVSEHKARRRVMIDVLKKDSMQYLDVLQQAVSNEDTETSHYAVSAIMEAKRKLVLSLQQLSVEYEENPYNEEVVKTYAEIIDGYMRSGFLDDRTMLQYRYTYLQVLDQYLLISNDLEWAFQEKIKIELKLGNYNGAEKSGQAYLQSYPYSENAYLHLLKIYYEMKSWTKLQQTLNLLKQSSVSLSNQALTVVRFWSEGA